MIWGIHIDKCITFNTIPFLFQFSGEQDHQDTAQTVHQEDSAMLGLSICLYSVSGSGSLDSDQYADNP